MTEDVRRTVTAPGSDEKGKVVTPVKEITVNGETNRHGTEGAKTRTFQGKGPDSHCVRLKGGRGCVGPWHVY